MWVGERWVEERWICREEGLQPKRIMLSIQCLYSFSAFRTLTTCQVVYSIMETAENKTDSTACPQAVLQVPAFPQCSSCLTHPEFLRLHSQNWAGPAMTPGAFREHRKNFLPEPSSGISPLSGIWIFPRAKPREQKPHIWSAISLDVTAIITLAPDKAWSQSRTGFYIRTFQSLIR